MITLNSNTNMTNTIAFSIFGFGQEYKNSFNFISYLRTLSMNIMMAELIYPNWKIYVAVDHDTYYSKYKGFFDYHMDGKKIEIEVLPSKPLCEMMLWRMRPIFNERFEYVICRDTDSLLHYREHQAVQNFILNGRAVHAITDSPSHNLSLMGGMIGFNGAKFRELINCSSWENMMALSKSFDFSVKGSDQSFLNSVILPKVDESIVEHYVAGMKQSWRGACYDHIQNDDVEDLPEEMRESNHLVEHIGQAGFIIEPVLKFCMDKMNNDRREYYEKLWKLFPQVHYWIND